MPKSNEKAFLDLKNYVKKIKKLVGKDIVSRKLLTELGNESAKRITLRTRLGYGVARNGNKRKRLKAMRQHSTNYTIFRKKSKGGLSSLTTAQRHNLTLTGKMLGAIEVEGVNPTRNSIHLGFKDEFSETKAEVNEARGWKFMNLSDIEIKALRNLYQKAVRKLAKDVS